MRTIVNGTQGHRHERMGTIEIGISRWALVNEQEATLDFLLPKLKQRLTPTIKMALEAAHQCVGDDAVPRSVFCSRYGEYDRTFDMLKSMRATGRVSPAAFGLSTHNVPSGIYAKNTGNASPTTTISAHASTLEAGFLEATLQALEVSEPVLLLYVDKPLPEAYGEARGPIETGLALAMLLDPAANSCLRLGWAPTANVAGPPAGVSATASDIPLLLCGNIPLVTLADGRLDWTWEQTYD